MVYVRLELNVREAVSGRCGVEEEEEEEGRRMNVDGDTVCVSG